MQAKHTSFKQQAGFTKCFWTALALCMRAGRQCSLNGSNCFCSVPANGPRAWSFHTCGVLTTGIDWTMDWARAEQANHAVCKQLLHLLSACMQAQHVECSCHTVQASYAVYASSGCSCSAAACRPSTQSVPAMLSRPAMPH
eukprot:scaffold247521_cov18-Tisochrysis_lutea.AAC.1